MKFEKLTPNLLVNNVETSMKFYQDVLGFTAGQTVPEQPPYVFGIVTHGNIEIFFNDVAAVKAEHPEIASSGKGGSMTMFIEIDLDIEALLEKVVAFGVNITMPMKDQFYGMREFTMCDPDGWFITFAQRIAT